MKQLMKPKSNGQKLRVINRGMGKVVEAPKCLSDEKRRIRKRFVEVGRRCDEVKQKSEMVMKQEAIAQLKMNFIFKIFKYWKLEISLKLLHSPESYVRLSPRKEQKLTQALVLSKNEVPQKRRIKMLPCPTGQKTDAEASP